MRDIFKGYKKVFMDAEVNGASHDIARRWHIPARNMEFKMAAINQKYLYLSPGLKYLRNSKGDKKLFMDTELNGPSDDLAREWRIPARIWNSRWRP